MKNTLVSVVFPLSLKQEFTYKLPQNTFYSESLLGARVRASFGNRTLIGFISGAGKKQPSLRIKTIYELIDSISLFPPQLYVLLQWAAEYYHHSLGKVLETALPVALRGGKKASLNKTKTWRLSSLGERQNLDQLRGIQQKKIITLLKQKKELHKGDLKSAQISLAAVTALVKKTWLIQREKVLMPQMRRSKRESVKLLKEQQEATNEVVSSLGSFRCFMLEGPTNSGKTEVYIEIIRQVLKKGKQILYMVPEISLSPQTLNRLEKNLDIPLGLMHSQMSARERLQNYLLVAQNKLQVLIGTRSTIFAPFPQLGCIIVDEEQDTSYKQQEGFRYNGKHLAVKYAQLLGIPIVLGSATPALESYQNISLRRYQHLRLTKKINCGASLYCRLMDMKKQDKKNPLPPEILEKMENTLSTGSQVLVFINRRGYAPILNCSTCGWVQVCSRCDRPMTLHKYPPHLSCHLCEERQTIPSICPECKSHQLSPGGFGTQRITDLLEERFNKFPVLRIDRDSMKGKDAYWQFYEHINRKEPCILVGTQIVAKGHDFADVRLAVVVNCDQALMGADFHTVETAAQLLTQVIGRVGRRSKDKSYVLIPTYHPDNPLLNTLLKEGYASFARKELRVRKTLSFPPYSYLAYMYAAASQDRSAQDFLHTLRKKIGQTKAQLLGPIECTPAKGSYHRRALILKAMKREFLHAAVKQLSALAAKNKVKDIRWHIDIDPQEAP